MKKKISKHKISIICFKVLKIVMNLQNRTNFSATTKREKKSLDRVTIKFLKLGQNILEKHYQNQKRVKELNQKDCQKKLTNFSQYQKRERKNILDGAQLETLSKIDRTEKRMKSKNTKTLPENIK